MVEQENIYLEQLEVIEKFVREASEEAIIESSNYLMNRVKVNIAKIQSSVDSGLMPRYEKLLQNIQKI